MARFYRHQARLFDLTRGPILLGRPGLTAGVRPGDAILEVGCGTGGNLLALASAAGPEGSVVGVECAPTMAVRARRRRTGIGQATIEVRESEYPGATSGEAFDRIVFSYSLSMIPDPMPALRQAFRDLKVGGHLVVLDFAESRWSWVRSWIRSCGVRLDGKTGDRIRPQFKILSCQRHRAWGLWSYDSILAIRPPDPEAAHRETSSI